MATAFMHKSRKGIHDRDRWKRTNKTNVCLSTAPERRGCFICGFGNGAGKGADVGARGNQTKTAQPRY